MQQEVEEKLEENEKAFNLKGTDVTKLQTLVQYHMLVRLSFDEQQTMFKSDVTEIIQGANQLISNQYGFLSPKKSAPSSKSVQFCDYLQPCFSPKGSLLGFKLREEMVKVMLMEDNFEIKLLMKLIKVCLFINRMFKDGKTDDFKMH